MGQKEDTDRKEIFSFRSEQREFDAAVAEIIRGLIEQNRNAVMSPDNVIAYSHGEGWIAWQQNDEETTHFFQEHTHGENIRFQDIIDHKLSILPDFILHMAEGVHSIFMKSVYKTLHEATEKTGNVVDVKQHGSAADAFLEMLRKIEFGVDRHGTVSRPQIHLPPQAYQKFVKDLEAQGDEFKKKVEEITAAKEAAALEREAKRRERFTKPTER